MLLLGMVDWSVTTLDDLVMAIKEPMSRQRKSSREDFMFGFIKNIKN
jgi:hypothetical protein